MRSVPGCFGVAGRANHLVDDSPDSIQASVAFDSRRGVRAVVVGKPALTFTQQRACRSLIPATCRDEAGELAVIAECLIERLFDLAKEADHVNQRWRTPSMRTAVPR